MEQTKEKNIIEKFAEGVRKGIKISAEIDRLKDAEKRIYELSRDLPVEDGLELIKLFDQSKKDIEKVTKVRHDIE